MATAKLTWHDDQTVSLAKPCKCPKKLTGTRLGAVLGLNRWSTPFQVWCEVTKTWAPPFEDTKYTLAGKAIEPKQIQYMREAYGMDDLLDPHDVFGADPFKATHGDFFDHPVLGGMWDAVLCDPETGEYTAVLEFKTTKRAEDWAEDVPEYYALQASLYAYLLGVDDVVMVASFLEEGDYEHPEEFVVSAANTATFEFKVSERYADFEGDYVMPALAWWEQHVVGGVSPQYDEKADAEYLKALRDTTLNPKSDVEAMMRELAEAKRSLEAAAAALKPLEKRVESLTAQLRQFAVENIGDGDTATMQLPGIKCVLSRSYTAKVNKALMKADGVFHKYVYQAEQLTFTVKLSDEE